MAANRRTAEFLIFTTARMWNWIDEERPIILRSNSCDLVELPPSPSSPCDERVGGGLRM